MGGFIVDVHKRCGFGDNWFVSCEALGIENHKLGELHTGEIEGASCAYILKQAKQRRAELCSLISILETKNRAPVD